MLPVAALCLWSSIAHPDISSPTATVASFVKALSSLNLKDACYCVKGAEYTKDDQDYEKVMASSSTTRTFKVLKVEVKADLDAIVEVKMKIDSLAGKPQTNEFSTESLVLEKERQGWVILPSKLEELYSSDPKDPDQRVGEFTVFTCALTNPDFMVEVNEEVAFDQRAEEMHRLAFALLDSIDDNHDKFPAAGKDLKSVLKPYEKQSRSLDLLSDHDGVKVAYNQLLAGKDENRISQPDKTVMLYESDHGKIGFMYRGRALVAFTDGSVRFVNKDEERKLLWKLP